MSDHAAAVEDSPSTLSGWFAVTGGIGAWLAHLVAVASLAETACGNTTAEWAMHATTLGCALIALASLAVAVRLSRDDSRPWRFVGQVGVISSLTNLLLILFEGSYVIFLGPCS